MSDDDFNEDEPLESFEIESREHIEIIEGILLRAQALIEASSFDSFSRDSLNILFRCVHTIKGSSGFLGLTPVVEVTHVFETILSEMRAERLVLDDSHVELLLEALDIVSQMMDDLGDCEEIERVAVVARMHEILAASSNPDAGKKTEIAGTVASEFEGISFVLPGDDEDEEQAEDDSEDAVSAAAASDAGTPAEHEVSESDTGDDAAALAAAEEAAIEAIAAEMIAEETQRLEREKGGINAVGAKFKKKEKPSEQTAEEVTTATEEVAAENKEAAIPSNDIKKKKRPDKDITIVTDTVRIRVDILDQLMVLASELVLVRNQQLQNAESGAPLTRSDVQRLDLVTSSLQETIMRTRMQPVSTILTKYNRVVRDLARKLGKSIRVEICHNDVEIDKSVIERLADPLTHIIRNSCDHGVEMEDRRVAAGKDPAGLIKISAYHEGGQITLEVADNGAGLNFNAIRKKAVARKVRTEHEISQMDDDKLALLILEPGFSTAIEVSDISGRGVGMDVVNVTIKELGGALTITSKQGQGTVIQMRLPLTLAIIPCMVVMVQGQRYTIPQVNLEELVSLYDTDIYERIELAGKNEVYRLRNELLPMVRFGEVLNAPCKFTQEKLSHIADKYREESEREMAKVNQEDREKKKIDFSVKSSKLATLTKFDAKTDSQANAFISEKRMNFAVVKYGTNRYGLIVDEIIGSEEVVVTPMHTMIRHLGIYSGATVMGDGELALILDVHGIASHAGLQFTDHGSTVADPNAARDDANRRNMITFSGGGNEQFGINVDKIRRIQPFKMNQTKYIGSNEFAVIEGVPTRIIRLDRLFNIESQKDLDEMFLLLPEESHCPYGILTSEVFDIENWVVEMHSDSYHEQGLEGAALVDGQLTLIVDLGGLEQKANLIDDSAAPLRSVG